VNHGILCDPLAIKYYTTKLINLYYEKVSIKNNKRLL